MDNQGWFDRPMTEEDVLPEEEEEKESRYVVKDLQWHDFQGEFDDLVEAEMAAIKLSWNDDAYGVWDNEEEEWITIAYDHKLFSC